MIAARVVALAVGVLAAGVLVGWYADLDALRTVVPGYVSMKPNTALGLLLLAGTTWLAPHRRRALPAAAAALGALALSAEVAGVGARFDLVVPFVDMQGDSARMAPATAVALVALGLGHVLGSTGARGAHVMVQVCGFLALTTGWLAIVGYAYGVSPLYTVVGYTSVAVHTAASLVLLAAGLLLLHPEKGVVAVLLDDGSAGRLARTLLPFLLVGPPMLGWLRLAGQEVGLFDTEFGVALLVTTMTALGSALTWSVAVRLRLLDGERNRAEQALRQANRDLEATVQARTAALRASHDRLETLIHMAPVGIVELDAAGQLVGTNAQWVELSGLEQRDAAGEGWAAAVHPEDVEAVREGWQAAVEAETGYRAHLRFVRPDGEVRWVQATTAALRDDDQVVGHLATVTDVTALQQARQQAASAQARFERAFTSSPLGTALIAPSGRIEASNDRLAEVFRVPASSLIGATLRDLVADSGTVDWLLGVLSSDSESRRTEIETTDSQGGPLSLEVHATPVLDDAHTRVLLLQAEDITPRRSAERRVEHLAMHDSLTDLPNRTLLRDRLGQALAHTSRDGSQVGVVFIDLDHFKDVNDIHGHEFGDLVLKAVASRLVQRSRRADSVARLGGDEFVVLCPHVRGLDDVRDLAAHMAEALADPIEIDGIAVVVGASVGVTVGSAGDDGDSLLRDADQAMYSAKANGRSRVEVYDDDLRLRIRERIEIETALRAATEAGDIEAWFQPLVELDSGRLAGHEALARWRQPHGGLVLPGRFIPVAEDTGLIREIGASVMLLACTAAADADPTSIISVNVSPRQFVGHDLGRTIEEALSLSGLAPERLWLELTESAVLEAIDSAAKLFQRLRRSGVRLVIDDFGTGYSSLARLRQFPVDVVKIDTGFVQAAATNDRDARIVQGITRLADSLELDVVAEGIETTHQRDLVADLGCRYGQGYLFAKPAPFPLGMLPVVPGARQPTSGARELR